MTDVFAALAAPFPPDRVSWRVGSMTKDKAKARALAYLDARDVMQRLDVAVGPANWQNRYTHVGAITVCDIGIKVDGEWLWKSNGAGHTDIEAEKGALSDAFKRAAVLWGVGQYLYDIDAPWVVLDEWKQIPKSELPKLRALLAKNDTAPSVPAETAKSAYQARKDGDYAKWETAIRECASVEYLDTYLRENSAAMKALPESWKTHLRDEVARHKQVLMQLEPAS